MSLGQKPPPTPSAYLWYVAHWSFMFLCDEDSPLYDSSWDAVLSLEYRYDWSDQLKDLRQQALTR